MTTANRYNSNWYNKRSDQNIIIRDMLINNIINVHKEHDFPFTDQQLHGLPVEDLLEIAIACANKNLTITVAHGEDYNDHSDAKVSISQHRNNVKQIYKKLKSGEKVPTGTASWTNSMVIAGVKGKNGAIRAICYNKILNTFEFYYFPKGSFSRTLKNIEIILERYILPIGQEPEFTGQHISNCKWNQYKCQTFEEMALANHVR